jgi:hypothetical protein
MDPEGPTPAVSDTLVLDSLPDAAVDALMGAAGVGSGSTLILAELRQLGGALGRPHEGAGALPKLEGQFVFFALGIAATPEMAATSLADASRAARAVAPWQNCKHYLNFAEHAVDTAKGFDKESYARLQALRAQLDPHGLMVSNHAIPAAGTAEVSLPERPPFLSGRRVVVIDGALLEDDERAGQLLAPLRALEPEMDTFARIPSAGLLDVHMDPPGPTPAVSDHAVLDDLPEEAVEALLGRVGPGTTTSLLFAELRHLGGALGRPDDRGGVLDALPGAYALFCVAVAPVPEAAAVGLADAAATVEALRAWSNDRHVLNFAERPEVDAETAYDPWAWARLRAVKAAVDPDGVFQANHEIA